MDEIIKNYNKNVSTNKSPYNLWNCICIKIKRINEIDFTETINSECIMEDKIFTIIIEASGIPHYRIFDELQKNCDCSYISEIDLSDNMYSPYQFNKIINSLININTLSINLLNLSNNNISDKGFKLLLEFISSKSCRNLQSLNLNNNILTNSNIKLFKKSILNGLCCHLRYLDLSNNIYDYKGIKSFCKVIYSGYLQELEQISFTCKRITPLTINCVCNAVQNGVLKRILLKSVLLNDEEMINKNFLSQTQNNDLFSN